MKKHVIAAIIAACLIGSCSPTTPFPTPLPTVTMIPTITRPATPTPIPQTSEHLIVTRDDKHLAVFNADGSLE